MRELDKEAMWWRQGISERVRSDDVICGLIGEAEAVVAAKQWSLMY